jgi:hypothetical protein
MGAARWSDDYAPSALIDPHLRRPMKADAGGFSLSTAACGSAENSRRRLSTTVQSRYCFRVLMLDDRGFASAD